MTLSPRSLLKWLTSAAAGSLFIAGVPGVAWAVDCTTPTAQCKSHVTSYDSYCTNVAWDSICTSECGVDPTCQAEVNCGTPDGACKGAVSVYDSYCTTTAWDSICTSECNVDKTCQNTANEVCGGAIDVSAGGNFTGSTAGYVNDYTASCGASAASPDATFKMKFATDKVITLDTFGSGYDTVLYVKTGTSDFACGGAELACNDDAGGGVQSSLTFTAVAGQMYFVVVDGYSSTNSGAFKLNVGIAAPTALSNDTYAGATNLPAVTASASVSTGTTADAVADYHSATCGGGAAGKDRVYKFTIGSTQTVTVDTIGSTYDTVLHIHDSAYNQVACDDDGGGSLTSKITATLGAGTYYAVVDGYGAAAGNYTLHVSTPATPPAVLFVHGHGDHRTDYVDYWGGTGGNALPVYTQARTSKAVTTHGYDHTLHLTTAALNLANDINATYPSIAAGTLTIVTHSAAGLILRNMMSHADDGPTGPRTLATAKIGHIVTIASPHNGTVLANLVEAGSITQWVGGLMGFNTSLVWDMQTSVVGSFGNCYGTTGVCAMFKTIGADGQGGGWMNDISTFLGIPIPGTGHSQDWGLMATGAIGRAYDGDFDNGDGFIAYSSSSYIGTNVGRSNANHFHTTRCDYRTDVCTWVGNNL